MYSDQLIQVCIHLHLWTSHLFCTHFQMWTWTEPWTLLYSFVIGPRFKCVNLLDIVCKPQPPPPPNSQKKHEIAIFFTNYCTVIVMLFFTDNFFVFILLCGFVKVLMKTYQNTKDHWRSLGYRKAITALKQHPKQVTSWEVILIHVQ